MEAKTLEKPGTASFGINAMRVISYLEVIVVPSACATRQSIDEFISGFRKG
jgi:hypothetical protein